MRTDEEIAADCLRVTDVIALLVAAAAEVGDSPFIIQDDDGAEYNWVEVNTETGDIGFIVEQRFKLTAVD